jgi:hypothetical protein
MTLVWTKNSLPLSWLIRRATGEPVSHFAVVFDEKFVIESSLSSGVRLGWIKSFLRRQTVVYRVEINANLFQEEEVYRSILDSFDGDPYDWRGILYFAWRIFLLATIGSPLPAKNAWGREGAFLCSEIACVLPEWVVPNRPRPDEMITPYGLFERVVISAERKYAHEK